jgi:acetolactate synthase-1/2/3 large subunit
MNIANLLVDFAVHAGAKKCFSVVGGMAMHLNHAIATNKNLEVTYTHHEQAAICGAEGYSKATNFQEFGFACITAGPGVANSITGLLSAYGDSTPLLVFAGQIKTSDIDTIGTRTHGIQEIRTDELIPPAVKKFIRIERKKLEDQILEIEEALLNGRPGPVFVEVPLDLQGVELEVAPTFHSRKSIKNGKYEPPKVKIIENKIKKAKNISIYIGNGVRISGLNVKKLLEELDRKKIPRFYSWLSFDLESYESELNMGCPGSLASIHSNQLLLESDLVIFLGARLDLASTAHQRDYFAGKSGRIIIDIDQKELLKFTSKSDLKVNWDIANGLDWLLNLLPSENLEQSEWAMKASTRKKIEISIEDKKLQSSELNLRNLALAISSICPPEFLIPASSGVAEETLTRFLRLNGKTRFFNGAALGSMGQGLSHGIGAIQARKTLKEKIFIMEADGGLWMAVHELATLSTIKNQNVALFILNNDGYGSIRLSQETHFAYTAGCDEKSGLKLPNWEDIALNWNFKYIRVETLQELEIQLLELCKDFEFKIIDVKIPDMEDRGPRLRTIIENEMIKTQSLKDISW